MIKKSTIVRLLTICLFASLFTGCLKDDKIDYDAICDVYCSSKYEGDIVKYALTMYTYSAFVMDSAKVTSPDLAPKVTILTTDNSYKTSFSLKPEFQQYGVTAPTKGKYIFDIVFSNNQKFTTSNTLTDKTLVPPIIDTVSFDVQDKRIFVDWDKVANTDAYSITLLNDEEETVFESVLLDSAYTSARFGKTTSGWKPDFIPEADMIFYVVVKSFIVEPEFGRSNYNLQAISESKPYLIIWDAQ